MLGKEVGLPEVFGLTLTIEHSQFYRRMSVQERSFFAIDG